MLDRILNHLTQLVACDTQNPPRAIAGDHRVMTYCADTLKASGCKVQITNLGDGCVILLATRGHAQTLINCHLDTVPVDPSWTQDPFKLTVTSDRATGLGACDIKGAAACLLTAVQTSDGPVALLLTTDEEAGQSRCVCEFINKGVSYERVIVAEPTGAKAVTQHRGLATFELTFGGVASHSSVSDAGVHNAVHCATQWCADAIALTQTAPYDNLRLNIGVIEGGTKANVVASSARVVFGMRPPPWMNPETAIKAFKELANTEVPLNWKTRFSAPGLDELDGVEEMLHEYAFTKGNPVDFWTEAALFAQAGLPTIVLGPGNIQQAHTADEFVMLEDLKATAEAYRHVFAGATESITQSSLLASVKGETLHDA